MSTEPTAIQPSRAPIPLRQPTGRAVLGRLPVPLSTLVGRERDVAAFAALLRDPVVRLITLTGPGGVGKTRLALQVAAEIADDFADGVAFVELASIRDPEHVAPAIVQALGIRPRGDQPVEAALQAFLSDQNLLLLLDNFEQVVAAGPQIADLLRASPELKVLVTSRTLLRISGERAAPVSPLSLPTETGRREDGETGRKTVVLPVFPSSRLPVLDSEAVRLFVERTREVRPDFVLTEANAADVAEICHRLDGLPLAIELAAARGQLFPPAMLLRRLEPRLPQLTHGHRDLPARLQTMQDAIAWSYDLLTPEEQEVFRCLGAFEGGCTLEAAAAVCGSPATPDVIAIEALARQNLIRPVDAPDGAPRLTMLETVREYAVKQLDERGGSSVRQRHAAYFSDLATQADRAYWGEEPRIPLTEIGPEVDNLRAALTWTIARDEADTALRLATAMFGPHPMSGANASEQRTWLHRALAMAGGSPAVRVKALARSASIFGMGEEIAGGMALAEEALALARRHNDGFGVAEALRMLGALATHAGDDVRARRSLLDALAGFRALGARGRSGWTLFHLAALEGRGGAGDLASAAGYCDEALAIFREIGPGTGLASALVWNSAIARKQGNLPQALASAREVLAMAGSARWSFLYLEDIADIAGQVGRPEVAARLYGAAAEQRERAGRPVEPALRDEHEREIAVARKALGQAAFADAFAAGRALTPEQAETEALAFTLDPPAAPALNLPPRAAEILPLLAAGASNGEIAAALYLSVRTVERHVARLFATLGVHSRSAAVEAARTAGLLPAPAAKNKAKLTPTPES